LCGNGPQVKAYARYGEIAANTPKAWSKFRRLGAAMPLGSCAELRVIDGQTDDYCEGLETIRPQSHRDVETVCVCNELCLNCGMPKILQRPEFYQLF